MPPSVHGICGNYLFDVATGTEVMMNDPKWLRAPTILAEFANAGQSVAVSPPRTSCGSCSAIGMKGICFSAEKADQATEDENGIDDVVELVGMPVPSVYSAELSEFVFAAGVELMAHERRPDVMYLSTTDYVQHKHAPGTDGADAFYRMMDGYLGKLDALGCDDRAHRRPRHEREDAHGRPPDVIYLQDCSTTGSAPARPASSCRSPIRMSSTTARSARSPPSTCRERRRRRRWPRASRALRGIESVRSRDEAAAFFELPADRIGDLVVVAERSTVIGTSASRHDLSGLDAPLRSHGGVSEQRVPLIVNRSSLASTSTGAGAISMRSIWR